MIALVRARASLPDLRYGREAYVDDDDPRWARRIATGRVAVIEHVPADDPEDDADAGWLPDDATVDETLAAVGDDPARARDALAREQARANPRATLIDALTRVIEG